MNDTEEIKSILQELESYFWLVRSSEPYGNDAFRASIRIFLTLFAEKVAELAEHEGIDEKDGLEMAHRAGKDFAKLVKTYSGIEISEL